MGKFVVYKTDTGYLFHLKAGNGETIGTSEVYTSLAACRTGIASVQKNAPSAALVDMTVALVKSAENPKFEVYRDEAGQFRFRLKAPNGEIVLASEGYTDSALQAAKDALAGANPIGDCLYFDQGSQGKRIGAHSFH